MRQNLVIVPYGALPILRRLPGAALIGEAFPGGAPKVVTEIAAHDPSEIAFPRESTARTERVAEIDVPSEPDPPPIAAVSIRMNWRSRATVVQTF